LLILNPCVKNHMYEYVVFLWKMMNNEVVIWWTWNEFMNNCVDDVWKHVVDELVWWKYHWWIDDESCCWCWIILKVWWNFEFRQNDVWFMSFEYSCVYVYVHAYKHYLGRVLRVRGSKLECLGKRVLKFKVIF